MNDIMTIDLITSLKIERFTNQNLFNKTNMTCEPVIVNYY
ncbi:MAG: hypothetical protein JWP44_1897 [Mucilaginibacter sp.]|nr:hypothetical protein [Mucilaginibacter sp.]